MTKTKTKCNTTDIVSAFHGSLIQIYISGKVHQDAYGKHQSRIILFAFLSLHFHN